MIAMDDATREALIRRYKARMLRATRPVDQRHWQGKMFALIRGRSQARVDEMEREQRLDRQMAPWAIK